MEKSKTLLTLEANNNVKENLHAMLPGILKNIGLVGDTDELAELIEEVGNTYVDWVLGFEHMDDLLLLIDKSAKNEEARAIHTLSFGFFLYYIVLSGIKRGVIEKPMSIN